MPLRFTICANISETLTHFHVSANCAGGRASKKICRAFLARNPNEWRAKSIENPAMGGVFERKMRMIYQWQKRRGPQGVGRKKQRRHAPQLRRQPPHGPRCHPSPHPPATCVMNDCCGVGGKSDAGTAPASKETRATIQLAAMVDVFKNVKNHLNETAPRANIIRPPTQIKAVNRLRRQFAAQSCTGSLADRSAPPCGSSSPISALPRRLRRGRG